MVTVTELLLTSVCRYPNSVNEVTAELVPLSGSATPESPGHVERFPLEFVIVE